MDRLRRIIYDFFQLPHVVKQEVARELNLTYHNEDDFFKNIKEQSLLNRLEEALAKQDHTRTKDIWETKMTLLRVATNEVKITVNNRMGVYDNDGLLLKGEQILSKEEAKFQIWKMNQPEENEPRLRKMFKLLENA